MTDIFDIMTREELLWWARNNCYPFNVPKKSALLYHRWDIASDKAKRLADEHCARGPAIVELAKKYDDLLEKTRQEKNPARALSFLDEAKTLSRKIMAHNNEYETVVQKAWKEAKRLYALAKKTQDEEIANARP